MLEGKTFLGATGMPMEKIARVSTRLAVWLPEPLTVAAWMVRSLTTGLEDTKRAINCRGGACPLRTLIRRSAKGEARLAPTKQDPDTPISRAERHASPLRNKTLSRSLGRVGMTGIAKTTAIFLVIAGVLAGASFLGRDLLHLACVGPVLPVWGCRSSPYPDTLPA